MDGPFPPAQRSDTCDRFSSRDAADAEQLERAGDLLAEDADRLVHPALPARHQPVQERPADQAGLRAEGQRGDHVPAVHDPGVQQDLGPVADRVGDPRQHLQRRGGPVQLAAAVGGDDDPVRAVVHGGAGVGPRCGCP